MLPGQSGLEDTPHSENAEGASTLLNPQVILPCPIHTFPLRLLDNFIYM